MNWNTFIIGFDTCGIFVLFIYGIIQLYLKVKPQIVRLISRVQYFYYQPNENDCGDCAIRAFTKVLNISWLEAFDLLTEYAREKRLVFSCRDSIIKLLIDKEFLVIDIKNQKLTFCQVVKKYGYRSGLNGVKFMLIAHNHMCAAETNRIYDSWDSRTEMCEYMILPKGKYPWLDKEFRQNKK